ncbi:hypothetical protein [Streptomyces sp. NPDC007205]|uniref:hypothetical protein n=1 Tax=Streptomyces sp. NPDC007205 TaxID=3154316 RepID=UPI0033E2E6A1
MNHTYEPPSLIPAPGQERTYALVIAGLPLLLILLMAVLPLLVPGGGNASGATSADGQGGYNYAPPPRDPPAPDTSTAYGTDPSTPVGGGDSTDLSPTPLDGESTPSTDGTDGTDGTGSADSTTGPGKTVNDFFDAINRRDFKTAWALGGKNLDMGYESFVAGFDTTEHDDVVVESVDGDTVSVNLNAQQTDGTQKSYTGQYTVVDGVITHASMTSAG